MALFGVKEQSASASRGSRLGIAASYLCYRRGGRPQGHTGGADFALKMIQPGIEFVVNQIPRKSCYESAEHAESLALAGMHVKPTAVVRPAKPA